MAANFTGKFQRKVEGTGLCRIKDQRNAEIFRPYASLVGFCHASGAFGGEKGLSLRRWSNLNVASSILHKI